MSLLARVAERIYWAGRYLERAESSARVIAVRQRHLLDISGPTPEAWQTVIRTLGASDQFEAFDDKPDDKAAMWFLVGSDDNGSAVTSCIHSAKENFRTARDILPQEAWHAVNEMELLSKRKLRRRLAPRSWCDGLDEIVDIGQRISGLLAGGMSRGYGYSFLEAGRHVERIDMTTRVLDGAVLDSAKRRNRSVERRRALWRTVLLSLSAYQMYRQHVRRQIHGRNVLQYLILDPAFPRSVRYNLASLGDSVRALPRHRPVSEALKPLKLSVADFDSELGDNNKQMHRWIDTIQAQLATAHATLCERWFPQ